MNRSQYYRQRYSKVFLLLLASAFLAGCATPPEPVPQPPPPAVEPEPPPAEPEPEPRGTAPLVGTTWELLDQYASEDIPNPSRGRVQFLFTDSEEPALRVEGPVNRITGSFDYTVKESKSDSPDYEEGSLSVSRLARTRKSGPYIRYEDLILTNMELVQGYYINGEHPLESRLTIFGGYGREEIILFVLEAIEVP